MQENSQSTINLEFRQIIDLAEYLPQIAAKREVKGLSLHGNRLKNLPKDLSSISQIEFLDISGNLFKGPVESIANPLKTLPRLKTLIITINSADEEKQLIKLLPNLEVLNGTRILKDKVGYLSQSNNLKDSSDSTPQQNYLNAKIATSNSANIIFNNKAHATEINSNAKMDDKSAIQNSRNSFGKPAPFFHETIDNSEVQEVLSLYELLSALKPRREESSDLLTDLHGHLSNILTDVEANAKQFKHRLAREIHLLKARFALIDIVFHNFVEILGESKEDAFRQHSKALLQSFYRLLTPIFKGFVDLAIVIEPKSESNFETLRERAKKTLVEPGSAIDRSEKLAKHNEEILRAWQSEARALHVEIIELKEEVKAAESENKILLDKLIKHTKERLEEVQAKTALKEASKSPEQKNRREEELAIQDRVSQNFPYSNNQPMSRKSKGLPKKLESLKETISELYEAKLAADKKNDETFSPRQTLEQFMYSHFKFKFGLKNLVADHAEQLILGVQAFKDYDVGVFVFGKMLRNEVDESYLLVHQNIKRAVYDSLRFFVQRKNPYLSQAAVTELVDKLLQNGRLASNDLKKIAGFLLSGNKKDLELFSRLLGEESEISVHEFEEKICHYRLIKYEAGLKPFNLVFKSVDEANIGVLSAAQLEELVDVLNKITEQKGFVLDAKEAIAHLDPHRFDSLTYSQIVQYFLSVAVEFNDRQLSYIQFFKLITK